MHHHGPVSVSAAVGDDEQSTIQHEAVLARLAWGLTGIGVLGGVAGLVLNSLDALPRGGTIAVSAKTMPDHVEIGVTDSGMGIAADMLSHLFQPFSSNKETGLGLGLVISKRIVEDHGGSIEAENLVTGGAAFRVRLPREKQELA